MKKLMGSFMILIILGTFGLEGQRREPRPSVKSFRVNDQISRLLVHDYVNMYVFNGPDGAMLIDSGFEPVDLIRTELNKLGINNIRYIVNTHSNGDHFLGNSLLGQGGIIISHSLCRERMAKREGFPPAGLPNMVFEDDITLSFNGEEIRMIHMPGHTDNDTVIHFRKSRIVFIGDLVFSDSFPGTQCVNGGNAFTLKESFHRMIRMFPDDVMFLSGHGRNYSMGDMRTYLDMIEKTIAVIVPLIRSGLSPEEIKSRHPLKEWASWNSQFFPGEITEETWIDNIYDSYKISFKSEPVNRDYLGQAPPGKVPEIFAPGIISHGFHELGIAISPGGDEIFYVTSDRSYKLYHIIRLTQEGCHWGLPEVASFSGRFIDNSVCFSADGNRLYFRSKRPPDGDAGSRRDGNFWMTDRTGNRWSIPEMLPPPVNTQKNESALSVAANGTLYFSASYEKEHGGDIYRSVMKDGKYGRPEKLQCEISTAYGEGRPFISPDESYLIFQSNRPGSLGYNDLYVSFRKDDGSWQTPVNLGEPVNSEYSEFAPHVSPDGKYLFFSSYRALDPGVLKGKSYDELLDLYRDPRNGYATIFWVDARVIHDHNQ